MTRLTWKMLVAAALLAWPGLAVFAQETEDAKLESFFKAYLDQRFHQQPLLATQLGDHRFDEQLEDLSKAARAGWGALTRQTLKDLPRRVDYRKLTRGGQIDFEILQHDLRYQIWQEENTHPFEEDPRTYTAYINDSVYLLLTQSTLPKETNIAHAIARMARIPQAVAAAREGLTHPPKTILETAIRQNRGVIGFYEKDLFDLAGDTPQLDQLKAAVAPLVPLLQDYQKFLEGELRVRATGDWRLGRAKFDRKFEFEMDAGISAEHNLKDAETEFARVRDGMYLVSRQLWSHYFPKAVLPTDDPMGRRETILKVVNAVGKEHGKPEELLADARATVEKIKTFIRDRDYLRLPDPDRCQVIEMPEFRRGNSAAYLDNAPPLDPMASSYYAVSPPPSDWGAQRRTSFLEEYNKYMLQILTLHEGYPGHYVQLEYANRVPSLIRRVLMNGAYVEGWAVYGEQTMLDQGYGDGDLRLRLMQQKFYLRAVGNSILDYKMHCTQMTDAEALKFLVEDAFQSQGEAELKIIRAKQSSVQLSTYFVGRMAHYRMHQMMEKELGDQFELGRFHEAEIAFGSIPVKYLPELVRQRLSQPR